MTESVEAEFPPCPECQAEYTYESGALLTCPMCGHEWAAASSDDTDADAAQDDVIRDAVGNPLADGDDVTVVKTVKISGGGGGAVKAGTKVRGIRLTADRGDGHDIDAKIPGVGKIQLKSSIVKKL
ncbi:zinc ribbon domain-containing protein YjdM [Leucobacter salsicius]|uniref:zinc ribbon domain-containing protein YjdM n=1 Tax=Leucobacter salsicius TaxID=664638 RepID=UPI00034530E1|nr:zinc ribbon domain-containing protein YjdM [Leucobacter salsicius]